MIGSIFIKKRPHFPVFKRKKHSMENILRKSDLTVAKLQMQVVDKGFYFVFQKHQRPGLN